MPDIPESSRTLGNSGVGITHEEAELARRALITIRDGNDVCALLACPADELRQRGFVPPLPRHARYIPATTRSLNRRSEHAFRWLLGRLAPLDRDGVTEALLEDPTAANGLLAHDGLTSDIAAVIFERVVNNRLGTEEDDVLLALHRALPHGDWLLSPTHPVVEREVAHCIRALRQFRRAPAGDHGDAPQTQTTEGGEDAEGEAQNALRQRVQWLVRYLSSGPAVAYTPPLDPDATPLPRGAAGASTEDEVSYVRYRRASAPTLVEPTAVVATHEDAVAARQVGRLARAVGRLLRDGSTLDLEMQLELMHCLVTSERADSREVRWLLPIVAPGEDTRGLPWDAATRGGASVTLVRRVAADLLANPRHTCDATCLTWAVSQAPLLVLWTCLVRPQRDVADGHEDSGNSTGTPERAAAPHLMQYLLAMPAAATRRWLTGLFETLHGGEDEAYLGGLLDILPDVVVARLHPADLEALFCAPTARVREYARELLTWLAPVVETPRPGRRRRAGPDRARGPRPRAG